MAALNVFKMSFKGALTTQDEYNLSMRLKQIDIELLKENEAVVKATVAGCFNVIAGNGPNLSKIRALMVLMCLNSDH